MILPKPHFVNALCKTTLCKTTLCKCPLEYFTKYSFLEPGGKTGSLIKIVCSRTFSIYKTFMELVRPWVIYRQHLRSWCKRGAASSLSWPMSLSYSANQWIGFYMIGTSVMKESPSSWLKCLRWIEFARTSGTVVHTVIEGGK